MTEGWECPRCHATYAPFVTTCAECKPLPTSLRDRLTGAQPTTPVFPALPVAPYAPPVYPAPLFPAPQWPYQDRIVWCETNAEQVTTWTLTLTPEARARLTMGAGAGVSSTHTITLNSGPESDEGDDGTAGVPAKI